MDIKSDEIIIHCCVIDPTKQRDEQAKTYAEKLAGASIPLSEYFEKVQPKKEWLKKVAENIAANVYGVEGTVTVE